MPIRMGLQQTSQNRTIRSLAGGCAVSTGQLRVYFGAAPGVGKTYKMLEEGHRRLERGTDVVIGFVETTVANSPPNSSMESRSFPEPR
jgi:K+-sensing histidine kinase KdpD